MGLTTNTGVMKFNVDGAERMRINSNATLTISDNLTVNGDFVLKSNTWHRSAEGVYRTYYATNEISYCCCCGNSTEGHIL